MDKSAEIGFIIFGVTGDLTKRKLIPALYELSQEGRIPGKLRIVGFARRPWTNDEMREILAEGIDEFARVKPVNRQIVEELLAHAEYVQGEFEKPDGFRRLIERLEENKIKKRIFYLATPPSAYPLIIDGLRQCERATGSGWTRIVIEKPFGSDRVSAGLLDEELHSCFQENQIYRIDHYLGKETVQNILVFRFANGIFEPLWNNHYVDSVQIMVAETVGVESRAGYFDGMGIIRDVFANHMLQMLSLTAMESPYAFNAHSVRDEKMKVLKALRPPEGQEVLAVTYRAQYGHGTINGQEIKGYLEEEQVEPHSQTETYFAMKLFIDNWRWAGVPFYLRCGKRLKKRATEIAIQFKQVPLSLFNWRNLAGDAPNILRLRLQPDEGINLSFGAKVPGPINEITPVDMDFCYSDAFGSEPPEAYERLLLDCMMGDATLFTRSDEALAQWDFTTGILKAWDEHPEEKLPIYQPGSWGAPGADELINKDGRSWLNPK